MMKENYSAECFAEQKNKSEKAQNSVRSKTGSVRSKMDSVRNEKDSGSRLNLFKISKNSKISKFPKSKYPTVVLHINITK